MLMVCNNSRINELDVTNVHYRIIEVQDQRTIEIELLLHLVQNPRGIHFGLLTTRPSLHPVALR